MQSADTKTEKMHEKKKEKHYKKEISNIKRRLTNITKKYNELLEKYEDLENFGVNLIEEEEEEDNDEGFILYTPHKRVMEIISEKNGSPWSFTLTCNQPITVTFISSNGYFVGRF